MLVLRVLAFTVGLVVVIYTLLSSIRNFVLPRGAPDLLSWLVFRIFRWLMELRMRWHDSYEERDSIMAMYAPLTLLSLVPTWMALVLLGYMGMYWAVTPQSLSKEFALSGSSLFTLGFATTDSPVVTFLVFTEACIGLILVALLIAYLPTMYSIFSQREAAVTQLAVRAGTPPSLETFVLRHHEIGRLSMLEGYWRDWEILFSTIEESHTSLSALVFFRSPQPNHSWITAAGAVMDAAAFIHSSVEVPRNAQSDLCIRAGFLALRAICDFFDIPYHPDPHFPEQTISISRQEYDVVCDKLAQAGVPIRANRDDAWQNFAGWRVNYDGPLTAICALVMAPYAPWSSDRSPRLRTLPFKSK